MYFLGAYIPENNKILILYLYCLLIFIQIIKFLMVPINPKTTQLKKPIEAVKTANNISFFSGNEYVFKNPIKKNMVIPTTIPMMLIKT